MAFGLIIEIENKMNWVDLFDKFSIDTFKWIEFFPISINLGEKKAIGISITKKKLRKELIEELQIILNKTLENNGRLVELFSGETITMDNFKKLEKMLIP